MERNSLHTIFRYAVDKKNRKGTLCLCPSKLPDREKTKQTTKRENCTLCTKNIENRENLK